jgi:hypothetical protein
MAWPSLIDTHCDGETPLNSVTVFFYQGAEELRGQMQDEWTPEDVLKVAGKAHLLPMLPVSMYNIAKVGLSRSRTHTILDPCAMMLCSSAVKSVNMLPGPRGQQEDKLLCS